MRTGVATCAILASLVQLEAGCIVVRSPQDPATAQDGAQARPAGPSTPYDDLPVYKDIGARVEAALRRGEADPAGALAELSDLRVQTVAARLGQHGIKADPKASATAPTQDPRAERTSDEYHSVRFGGAGFFGSTRSGDGDTPDPVEKLLRKIKHARGKLLASGGQRDELVRELAPPGLWAERYRSDGMTQQILHYQDIESCAPDETVCKDAYRALVKATDEGCRVSPYVSDNFRSSGAEAYICDFANETWIEGTQDKKPFFHDVRVRGISKTAAGEFVIQGASSNPSSSKTCDGEYQTDKILSVTDKEIVVERTTWCQGRRTLFLDGYLYVVRLPAGAFEPRVGDLIRVFVRPKDLAIRKQGRVTHVTVNRPLLTQVSVPQGTRYRFGTPFDWQFAGGGGTTPKP